jgi:hypothetical protein
MFLLGRCGSRFFSSLSLPYPSRTPLSLPDFEECICSDVCAACGGRGGSRFATLCPTTTQRASDCCFFAFPPRFDVYTQVWHVLGGHVCSSREDGM